MTHTSNRVAAAFIACLAAPLSAQAPSWFLPHNQVAPSVTTTVSLDASGDFRYRYTVGNGAGAAQRIHADPPGGRSARGEAGTAPLERALDRRPHARRVWARHVPIARRRRCARNPA